MAPVWPEHPCKAGEQVVPVLPGCWGRGFCTFMSSLGGGGLREPAPASLRLPEGAKSKETRAKQLLPAASAFFSWQWVSVLRGTPAPCWGWGGGLSQAFKPLLGRDGVCPGVGKPETLEGGGGEVQQEDWACGGTLRRSLAVGLWGVSLLGWWPWVGCC